MCWIDLGNSSDRLKILKNQLHISSNYLVNQYMEMQDRAFAHLEIFPHASPTKSSVQYPIPVSLSM